MHNSILTFRAIAAIGFIFIGTSAAWFILGGAMTNRSFDRSTTLNSKVEDSWGPELLQEHPMIWFDSPAKTSGRSFVAPSMSNVNVALEYEPKRKGLFLYRTYKLNFTADYEIKNPTPIEQVFYVTFKLPSEAASYNAFKFQIGNTHHEDPTLENGQITQSVTIPANESVILNVGYETRGLNRWSYDLHEFKRIQNFNLKMGTNFNSIDFPPGTSSPTDRLPNEDEGWVLMWIYPDVIGAQSIGMDMPAVLNAGYIASRMSFFAPVSLLFFFAVLLILGATIKINLHPMNYFFLAAGCFAFQLLFAYTIDLLPVHLCFFLSATVSMALVCGYLHAVGGKALSSIAIPSQIAYMVLFSYSFFFDGLSGLTIAVGAIATLAVLMWATARLNWQEVFSDLKGKAKSEIQSQP